jgi:hypothetical protein
MPDGPMGATRVGDEPTSFLLSQLKTGGPDCIGAKVLEIFFRGESYAIYRSDRGVYVQFSDDLAKSQAQRSEYVKVSVDICELRYLTSQMRPGWIGHLVRRRSGDGSLYDQNIAQALMLLMESAQQRLNSNPNADETVRQAQEIAKSALDRAIRRNMTDNTIRYVRTCVIFGAIWLAALLVLFLVFRAKGELAHFLVASAMGIVGAVFSVIVRAQSFQLTPCDDSGMNDLMSSIRVGMGGLAGPALLLLLNTVFAGAMSNTPNTLDMIAIVGLIGGFAERLVPNLVQGAADKIGGSAATPGQAAAELATTETKADTKRQPST